MSLILFFTGFSFASDEMIHDGYFRVVVGVFNIPNDCLKCQHLKSEFKTRHGTLIPKKSNIKCTNICEMRINTGEKKGEKKKREKHTNSEHIGI